MVYADDRKALLDRVNLNERAMKRASEWARVFVDIAPQSGCHLAALSRCLVADRVWREAEEAFEEFEDDPVSRAFHVELNRRYRWEPTDAEIDRALDHMDRILGEGWLKP